MDSLSQLLLGAAVAELTLGRKLGNKALLIGIVAGTLPDLDVIKSIYRYSCRTGSTSWIYHSFSFWILGSGFVRLSQKLAKHLN